jgi:type I restriction enzyme M protein
MEELGSLEAKIANRDSEFSEMIDEIEMDENGDEENGKTVKSVKSYLKEQIGTLKQTSTDSGAKENAVLEAQLQKLEAAEKELKNAKKTLKDKEEEIKKKVDEKRKTFTETEAKELIQNKFHDLARDAMYRYLNSRKRNIVDVIEKLWDKYRTPLSDLSSERDKASKQVDGFLEALGYCR